MSANTAIVDRPPRRHPGLLNGLLAFLAMACTNAYAGTSGGFVQLPDARVLSLPVNGVIQAIEVGPGSRVKRGDLLLSLFPAKFDNAIELAKAGVDRIEPAWNDARREFERAQELYDRTVIAEVELRAAQTAFTEKDAEYRAAGAHLEKANLDKSSSVLLARQPMIVLSVEVIAGSAISGTDNPTSLLRVVTIGEFVAKFAVPISQIDRYQPGASVGVHRVKPGGDSFSGIVTGLQADADADGVSETPFVVTVFLNSPAMGKLLIGEKLEIRY